MGENCTVQNTLFTVLPNVALELSLQVGGSDSDSGSSGDSWKDEGAMVLEWIGTGQLVFGKGPLLRCGTVSVAGNNGVALHETVTFVAAPTVQHVGLPVRASLPLRNGTVAVLAAGVSGGVASLAVWHADLLSGEEKCAFTVVQEATLGGGATGTVVDAGMTESWGWHVLLSSGAVALERRSSEALLVPAQFTAKSLYVDEETGLALLAGSVGPQWALYSTSVTSSGTPISAVTVTAAGPLEYTGVAWRVSTAGRNIHVMGTAPGEVWAASGTITDREATPNLIGGVEVAVAASASVSIAAEVLALSLSAVSDGRVATLLGLVQTAEGVWATMWQDDLSPVDGAPSSSSASSSSSLSDASEGTRELQLTTLQNMSAYVSAALPTRMMCPSNGLLLLCQPSSRGVQLHTFTGYAVSSLSPTIVDPSGVTVVVVRGIRLRNDMSCVLSRFERTNSTWINSSAVQCVTEALVGGLTCSKTSVDVAIRPVAFNAATNNGVRVMLLPTPHLTSAYGGDSNGPYASVASGAPISVIGQGFADAPALRCRFEDAVSRYETQAKYVTSRQVTCDAPAGPLQPSRGNTGTVSVSLDSQIFAPAVPFTFIGSAARLDVVSPAGAAVTVRSAAFVALPPIQVDVVDAEGHPLRQLDATDSSGSGGVEGRVVQLSAPWLVSTRKEVANPLNPQSFLVALGFSNTTVAGSASFTVNLQYPLVSVGLLTFTTPGLQPAQMSYTVLEGDPKSIAFAVQPSLLLDASYAYACRQPVAVFKDAAGNTVSNQSLINALTGGYVYAHYPVSSGYTVEEVARVNSDGLALFTDVHMMAAFGFSAVLEVDALSMISAASEAATMQACHPDEYGQYGTSSCSPCLPHTTCDGGYTFNVTDGYWKGGELAYDVYSCPNPRACRGGACAEGYTGLRCEVCSRGYGLSAGQCTRCPSEAANVVLLVMLILFVLFWAFAIILIAFQVVGPHFNTVHSLVVAFDFAQFVFLVLLPLPELPKYVQSAAAVAGLVSMGDALRLSPVSCLFGLNAPTRFVTQIVGSSVVFVVLAIALAYANVIFARRWSRLRRRRWFLRLLAPFPSEEAYHHRLNELGLDEEHALARVAVTDAPDPRQRKLREAYALLDKNWFAITAVGELPQSAVRDAAMRSLLKERSQLQHFLEQYETFVSCSDGLTALPQGTGTSRGSTSSGATTTPQLPSKSSFVSADSSRPVEPRRAGEAGGALEGEAGGVTAKEEWDSSDRLSASPAPRQDSDAADDGAVAAAAAGGLERFDGITATPFNLFGTQEPFNPTPTHLQYLLLPHLTPARREGRTAPQYRAAGAAAAAAHRFLWPPLKTQIGLYVLSVYHYFYVPTLMYSLSLVRCDSTVILSTPAAKLSNGVNPISRTYYRSLVTDRTVNCDTNVYRRYRVAGIVLGSVFGAALPLLLIVLSILRHRSPDGGVLAYARECCLSFYALHVDFLWWEAVVLMSKAVIVVFRLIVPSIHLAAMLVFWTVCGVLSFTVYLQPYFGYLAQSLEVVAFLTLSLVAALQQLPLWYYASEMTGIDGVPIDLAPPQNASGVLVVLLPCLALVLFFGVAWMAMFPRWRWRALDAVLFHLGGGAERADSGSSPHRTAPPSFEVYNMHLVRQAEHCHAAAEAGGDGGEGEAGLETQIVQAVRGKAAGKTGRRGSALWANLGMVGAAVGMANHVRLFCRFIDENEIGPTAAAEGAAARGPIARGPPATSPLQALEEEVVDELSALSEHLRQLERFVRQMEKAVERRTTSG